MKHEIEGSDLRACIDKAYDAGYKEAIRKACHWIKKNFIFNGYGTSLYYKGILYDPENIANDLEKYLNKVLKNED